MAGPALPDVRPVTGMNIDELLAQARPAERTVPTCLRGDLVATIEDLEHQLAQAQLAPDDSSLAGSRSVALARQIEAVRAQMAPATVPFRLRALPRRDYQALTDAHPPRREADGSVSREDAAFDVNTNSFWPALVRACLVDPELSAEQWDRLDEVLSDAQFEALALAAWRANRGEVDVPFSPAASAILRHSGGGSSAPNGSESLSGVSTGGSLASLASTTNVDN